MTLVRNRRGSPIIGLALPRMLPLNQLVTAMHRYAPGRVTVNDFGRFNLEVSNNFWRYTLTIGALRNGGARC
jgi:hypothetical protein